MRDECADVVDRDIDFDEPRAGPVCVTATAGDVLNFHWDEYHNLFELSNYEDYLGCDFEDATKLANANPTCATSLQSAADVVAPSAGSNVAHREAVERHEAVARRKADVRRASRL